MKRKILKERSVCEMYESLKSGGHEFCMIRHHDVTGCSGTGIVLEGSVMPSGVCYVLWRCGNIGRRSLGVYDTLEDFTAIHVDSHPENETEIIWKE